MRSDKFGLDIQTRRAHLATALAEIMICMKQEGTSTHLVARMFGKKKKTIKEEWENSAWFLLHKTKGITGTFP